jgi:hypothetical protein
VLDDLPAFVDLPADGVAVEVQPAEPSQRGLGVGGVPVGRLGDPFDPDVRPEPERDEDLAAACGLRSVISREATDVSWAAKFC